jgi:arylsulfatase A-like enzyme
MTKGAGIDRRDLLAFGLSTGLSAAAPASRSAPNILHIMTDQQQWATIGGRSQCRTPRLNQLADEGMTFERSYTPSAVCCPARAMILSGAYHWHNGVFNQIHSSPSVHRDMYPDVVLYANRLKDVGYRLGYTGKWHASWTRGPAHFGYEMAAVQGATPPRCADTTSIPTVFRRQDRSCYSTRCV